MNIRSIHHRKLLAAMLLGLPLAVHAGPDAATDWDHARYASLQLGANHFSSWPATVNFGGPEVDAKLDLDRGLHFGLALGRQRERMRYELEYQHGSFDITRATVADRSETVDAKGKYDVLTANAVRDLPIHADASLFAGLGIGFGKIALPGLQLASGCKCLAQADKSGFAWQARIGAEHRLGDAGRGFVQLGWLSLPKPEAALVSYRKKGTAVLSIGLRQRF